MTSWTGGHRTFPAHWIAAGDMGHHQLNTVEAAPGYVTLTPRTSDVLWNTLGFMCLDQEQAD